MSIKVSYVCFYTHPRQIKSAGSIKMNNNRKLSWKKIPSKDHIPIDNISPYTVITATFMNPYAVWYNQGELCVCECD